MKTRTNVVLGVVLLVAVGGGAAAIVKSRKPKGIEVQTVAVAKDLVRPRERQAAAAEPGGHLGERPPGRS
jgi:hypothetical protein